jgi:hypothetical protein
LDLLAVPMKDPGADYPAFALHLIGVFALRQQ